MLDEPIIQKLVEEPITTKKVPCITTVDEKQYAQVIYDLALEQMLNDPSLENIKRFTEANKRLFEVQDNYRIALRLLAERAKELASSKFGLKHNK